METGRFIDFISLCNQNEDVEFAPYMDIGWRLDTKFWNTGCATECVKSCLNYAFYTIHPPEVLSIVIAVNKPSLNVTKKIGMVKYLDFVHPKHKEDERLKNYVCYRIEDKS